MTDLTPEQTNQAERASNQAERASIQTEHANIAQNLRDAEQTARDAEQADAVEVVKNNLESALIAESDRRKKSDRESRLWRLIAILVLCCNILTVLYFRSYIAEGRKITTNTNHLVAEIDAVLGPKGRAASEAATQESIDNLVAQVREGNSELCANIIQVFEKNGILPVGTSANCVIP